MWYQQILDWLDPDWNNLYLVKDPDGLLAFPSVKAHLTARGQTLIQETDPLRLRLQYEQEWRAKAGPDRPFLVLSYPGQVPWDIVEQGKDLELSLAECFPELDPNSLKGCDEAQLQTLWQALKFEKPERTSDFLRRHLNLPSEPIKDLLKEHLARLEQNWPPHDCRWPDWLKFAWEWAEWKRTFFSQSFKDRQANAGLWETASQTLDSQLINWLGRNWNSLLSLPPAPVLVHHIPHFLARERSRQKQPVALLVLDGLALDQWLLLEASLRSQVEMQIRREAAFAWLPTLTGVSRRAVFNGQMPVNHQGGRDALYREEKEWKAFWTAKGEKHVQFGKTFTAAQLPELEANLDTLGYPVLGLILNNIDDMMHGMTLGNAGLYGQIETWMEQGLLAELLNALLRRGYTVFLTADHGNTEVRGCGRLSEGAIPESEGERVRFYSSRVLRDQAAKKHSFSFVLDFQGLPEDCHPLFVADRQAFVAEGHQLISHGGPTLEELMVPWIRIWRE
ncbi:MAG: hypothetical protein CVV27_00020 [Candidatus Melainabacteria bacterium HGW-Melainabacteria-1]|nr:MAG: hypothetical protein CVV27_00020 [Candidatus Melainabacteria bacterium HGW-Melainabacteria-1]